jgi:hypothetical protein
VPKSRTRGDTDSAAGDADIFDCPSHGVFKVANTLTALPKCEWASIFDWESAKCRKGAYGAGRMAAHFGGRLDGFSKPLSLNQSQTPVRTSAAVFLVIAPR